MVQSINAQTEMQQVKPQLPYSRNDAFEAMQNDASIITSEKNEAGYVLNVFDEENRVYHTLIDSDSNEIFDKYIRTEYDENGNGIGFYDDDFDENFDRVVYFKHLEDGNVIASADNDLDGIIDSYSY